MEEIKWRPVKGYTGYYEVSNTGQIKSLTRTVLIPTGTRAIKEKLLKLKINNDGYAHIQLSKNGKSVIYAVHRLVAEHFHEKPSDKLFVNHINGNKLDNAAENLEWVNRSENMRHAFKLGLCSKKNRKLRVIDKCTGNIYNTIKIAAISNNLNYSKLRKYLTGRRINKTCLELYDNGK